jgi:hypothetical protein
MNSESKGVVEGIFSTIGAFVVLFGIAFALFRVKTDVPSWASDIPVSLVMFVANIFPFALLAYGFVSDTIFQEFRLSLPSLMSLGLILLVGGGSKIFATRYQNQDLSPQDSSGTAWCTIPGLEGLESPYLPTAFMSTAVISFYYLCWAWDSKINSTTLGLVFLAIWALEWIVFQVGDCSSSYLSLFGSGGGFIFLNIVVSTVIGIIGGAIAFATVRGNQAYNPLLGKTSGSFSMGWGVDAKCPAGTSPAGNHTCEYNGKEHFSGKPIICETGYELQNGACVPSVDGYSQPVQSGGDENTFVAEIYKNGQLVTNLSD